MKCVVVGKQVDGYRGVFVDCIVVCIKYTQNAFNSSNNNIIVHYKQFNISYLIIAIEESVLFRLFVEKLTNPSLLRI